MKRLALLLCSLGAACGPAPGAKELGGHYQVMIASQGLGDADEMIVTPTADGVLLGFVYGISPIRCTSAGGDSFSIQSQTLRVSHSTGAADGTATGSGTLTVAMASFSFSLVTPGFSGGADGGTGIGYTITGIRR